jgi:hypothetical protein
MSGKTGRYYQQAVDEQQEQCMLQELPHINQKLK